MKTRGSGSGLCDARGLGEEIGHGAWSVHAHDWICLLESIGRPEALRISVEFKEIRETYFKEVGTKMGDRWFG